jgi:hypothetical protein
MSSIQENGEIFAGEPCSLRASSQVKDLSRLACWQRTELSSSPLPFLSLFIS